MPSIITAIIGPTEHNAVMPNASSLSLLSERIDAKPVPIAIKKGTLIGPVVTPPESNANGKKFAGVNIASTNTTT